MNHLFHQESNLRVAGTPPFSDSESDDELNATQIIEGSDEENRDNDSAPATPTPPNSPDHVGLLVQHIQQNNHGVFQASIIQANVPLSPPLTPTASLPDYSPG